jgi:hypothetical protein
MPLQRIQGQLTPFSARNGPWRSCCCYCKVLDNCLPSASKLGTSRSVQIPTCIFFFCYVANFNKLSLQTFGQIGIYICKICIFGLVVPQPLVGQDLLFEVPRSDSDTQHSVGLLLTNDQSDTKTSTWRQQNTHERHPCHRRDSKSQFQQASSSRPTP